MWIEINDDADMLNADHIVSIDSPEKMDDADAAYHYVATLTDGSTYEMHDLERPQPGAIVPNTNHRLELIWTELDLKGKATEIFQCPIVAWRIENTRYGFGAKPIGIDGGDGHDRDSTIRRAVLNLDSGACIAFEWHDTPYVSVAAWREALDADALDSAPPRAETDARPTSTPRTS